uniref:Transmembrane p24 trafficking protein 1 n=1 Tax=Molossus molossus TaxID=27622 RepID=A0A7J8ICY2_MOLMO|nr:transmembrane p24 trafficking protein 1 [Molossus molossus]
MLDVKMEDIKESIETMRTRLERSIQMLTLLRAFEARDRNLQEGNLERVNFWSAVNVAVLLLVAVLQVCTLKRFFQARILAGLQVWAMQKRWLNGCTHFPGNCACGGQCSI